MLEFYNNLTRIEQEFPSEFHEEMKDKLAELHYYDCLRTNKSMLASGVETRVPFLGWYNTS